MEQAAKNPGGGNAGIEMGMGFAMAQQMGQAFNQSQANLQPQAPPPIPQASQYFVAVNGQQQGPFPLNTLQQMIQQGSITRDTLFWKQGMASWTKGSDVADVSSFFGSVPPPLPQ